MNLLNSASSSFFLSVRKNWVTQMPTVNNYRKCRAPKIYQNPECLNLCLDNSISSTHQAFGFIYHLDGQRCSLKHKRSGYIKTWISWIYLCLLNSIKHPIFGFIYHLDGQRCSLKLKRSGYSKTWMSYIYICCLNTNKHNIFCFIYHLDGQRDTIKTVSDRPVCINT